MKRYLLLPFVPLVFSIPLPAQGPQQGPPRLILQALDTNHDGQLSAAEIAGSAASLLTLDRNGDGRLTSDEYNPKLEDKTATSDLLQRLMVLDRNGDGVLSADEVPERMKPMFERGDANHDGKLTADEIKAMSAKQADPQGRPVGRGNAGGNLRMDPVLDALDADHDGVFSAEEIAAAPTVLKSLDKDADGMLAAGEIRVRQQTAAQRAEHLFDEWDTNKDGALLKEEMPDRMQAQFDSLDTNHDGKVDLTEATAYFAAMPQGRPGGPAGQARPAAAGPDAQRP